MDRKVKYFTQQWQPMTPMHCSNMCSNHQWQCFESLQSSLVGAFFMSYLCHISALLLCPNSVSLALPLVYQRFCQDPLDNLQTLPYQTSLSPHPRKQQSCNSSYCPLSDLCWRSPKLWKRKSLLPCWSCFVLSCCIPTRLQELGTGSVFKATSSNDKTTKIQTKATKEDTTWKQWYKTTLLRFRKTLCFLSSRRDVDF